MLNWLNPFKWWQRFQQNRRWKVARRQFIHYYHQRDFATAETMAQSMVDIATKSGNRKLRLESYYNLMLCYRELEQLDLAIDYCERVLDLQRSLSTNSEDPILVERICDLADLLQQQGKMADAIKLYGEASTIRKRIDCGRGSKQGIDILERLAAIYVIQSNEDRAQKLLEEARIYRRNLGLVADLDEWDSAIAQIKSRHRGEHLTDIERWQNLSQEVLKLYKQGEIGTAIPIAEQALQLAQEIFPSPNNDLAASLNNLAGLYQSQGRWNEAEPHYNEALAIHRHLFGKTGHPDLVTSLTNLAMFLAQQKQPELALPLFQEAIATENLWLTNVLAINDSEQRLKELDRRQIRIEYLLSFTQQYFPNEPEAVTAAFNAVLSRKAQGVTAEAAFSRALSDRPELAPQIEAYRHCQQQIANLVHLLPTQPELQQRFDELLQHRRDLEKNLARSIPAIDLAQQVIDRQALTTLLPDGACLVEFVRYRDVDFIKGEGKAARYIAFIVQPQRAGVTAIDCGLAEPLDLAIAKFRRVYEGKGSNLETSDTRNALKKAVANAQPVIQPEFFQLLLPHLPSSGTGYLAPDGDLHLLPFHLLKTSDGNYLGDRFHLHHLTTARDLYRQKFPTSTNQAVIFADPDYDGGILSTVAASPKSGEEKSHDVCGETFDRLPINRILGDAIAKAYQVPFYTDIEATVDRLDRLKAPQVLAIATHGFTLHDQKDFIEELLKCKVEAEEEILRDRREEITPEFRDFWHQAAADGKEWCERILAKIDAIGIHTQDPATMKPNSIDLLSKPTTTDPMLRSGIALAGANIWRFQGTETEEFGKGVVFAHDIAQWDLWGTELALMITCVSGLGAIKNSEGVFGLRRALSIAGAKYVITSLWNIPTKPSVLLMDKFFELYRSAARPTPPQALTQAQNYVRNITLGELKEFEIGRSIVEELQGETVRKLSLTATDDVNPLADPHYWGAWICQG